MQVKEQDDLITLLAKGEGEKSNRLVYYICGTLSALLEAFK